VADDNLPVWHPRNLDHHRGRLKHWGAPESLADFRPNVADWLDEIPGLPLHKAVPRYQLLCKKGGATDGEKRYLALIDRYFLLIVILKQEHILKHDEKGNKWLYDRCREVERAPDGYLDLWARGHYKTTFITFGGSIQDHLRDPELTTCFFSHIRPISKGFLRQIKIEYEQSENLKTLFPDCLWDKPKKDSPKWSEDEGLICRRRTNPKEATFEAWGLVDGQPTSKHYGKINYDDVVTRESVSNPEMIQKVTETRELSTNLKKRGGREQNIGTRYNFSDTYGIYLARGILKPRIYAATHNGQLEGEPVFLTQAEWAEIKRNQPTQVAAQHLQNPAAGADKPFRAEWLKSYLCRPYTMSVFILVDPSKGSPNRRSDMTGMPVLGMDAASNIYLLDGYCHKMSLDDRWKALKTLYTKWSKAAGVQSCIIGYEQYGMLNDIAYFDKMGEIEGTFLPIDEVNTTRDHTESKNDRIERLVPDVKNSRFYIPGLVYTRNMLCSWREKDGMIVYEDHVTKAGKPAVPKEHREMSARAEGFRNIHPIKRVNEAGEIYDLSVTLIEQIMFHPVGRKDLLDGTSRIYDVGASPPRTYHESDGAGEPTVYVDT